MQSQDKSSAPIRDHGAIYDQLVEALKAASDSLDDFPSSVQDVHHVVFNYLRAQLLMRYDAATGCGQWYPHRRQP